MRQRNAFFSLAVAATAVLFAGAAPRGAGAKGTPSRRAVIQQASPLTTCTTAGETRFTVTRGPSFVPCPGSPGEPCTEIEYQVSAVQGSFVYALEGKGVVDVYPNIELRTVVGAPCEGVDSFGAGACHQQAIRTVPDEAGRFRITLAGAREPSPTSVAINPEVFESCEILGVGLQNTRNPDQITQATETVDFKGCVVEFTRDVETGEVLRAELTQDSPGTCTSPFQKGRTLLPQPVTDLEIRLKDVNGTSLGKGKFGDGYISTGGDTCTTRVIGGRVYTWGSPCP